MNLETPKKPRDEADSYEARRDYIKERTLTPEEGNRYLDNILESEFFESPNHGLHGCGLHFLLQAMDTGKLVKGKGAELQEGLFLTPIEKSPYDEADIRPTARWYAFNNAFTTTLLSEGISQEVAEYAPLVVDIAVEAGLETYEDLLNNKNTELILKEMNNESSPGRNLEKAIRNALKRRGFVVLIDHTGYETESGDIPDERVVINNMPYNRIIKVMPMSGQDYTDLMMT